MRIEGEVFREPKPEIGQNRRFGDLEVSFYGSLHASRADLPLARRTLLRTFRAQGEDFREIAAAPRNQRRLPPPDSVR